VRKEKIKCQRKNQWNLRLSERWRKWKESVGQLEFPPSRNKNIQGIRTVPDPEVRERAVRRRFTAEYKLRILKEAESCAERGQLGDPVAQGRTLFVQSHYMETSDGERDIGSPVTQEERAKS